MDILVVSVLRLIDALLTLAFFPNLYSIYRRTNRRFYLLWGVGFLLYGINVILRAVINVYGVGSVDTEALTFLFMAVGLTLIITGIGDLINRTRTFLGAALGMFLGEALLYFMMRYQFLDRLTAFLPYLLIATSLLMIRLRFTAPVDFMIIGWMMMALTDIGYAFGLISPLFVEVYVILAKGILYYGLLYSAFPYMVDDLRRTLMSEVRIQFIENPGERFILINSSLGNRTNEVQWIRDHIGNHSKKEIKTIVLSTYDLISHSDLSVKGVDTDNLYVVRIVQGGKSVFNVFKEYMTSLNDDLNDLDILFTEILAFSSERGVGCQIILYTLSSLIHTHGWKRVYTFLLSKISYLKNSNVYLYAFYYPGTHEVESDIAKFEQIADIIIET